MGVQTTADDKKDSALEHIKQAIQDLHDFTSPDTWGHDDYPDRYMDSVIELEHELKVVYQKLK